MLSFDLSKRLDSFCLSAALTVEAGEVCALVGPSGAGKTTLLRCLAGLERPDSGRILLKWEILYDSSRKKYMPAELRRCGFLFQSYALFPHLTVWRNITFSPGCRATKSEAMAICADFGILDILQKHPSQISGGERQRVALARAAVADSRYYLLDEPFAALDVKTRYSVRTALKTALNRLAKPALVVTHDYADALVLADKIAVIEQGEITQIGTPGDLHLHPRTEFTAALAGVNFYKGVCRESGVVEIGPVRLRCAAEPAEEIFVSFLPSDVSLWRDKPQGSPRNVFVGRVTELVPYPGRSRVDLEAELPIVAEITAEAVQGLKLKPGDTVYATVKAVNVRVYA